MTKKLNVGIVGWKVGENSFGATTSYLDFIQEYCGIPHILDPSMDFREDIDLLILPGGSDVDVQRYHEYPSYHVSKPDPFKEFFDRCLLPQYIGARIPIFGICRGFQTLAVHFGGGLIQHYMHEYSGLERNKLVHELSFTDQVKDMYQIYRMKVGDDAVPDFLSNNKYEVNSLHHQLVREEDIKEVFIPIARYKGDHMKSLEAFIHRDLPIAGVQYHPEELGYDELAVFLIEYLTKIYSNEETKSFRSKSVISAIS